MPYGYIGQNQPNQTVSNSGVFSITDVAELQSQGKLGGSLELIAEETFTGVTFVDFTSIQENKYDVHYAVGSNIVPNTDANSGCNIQFYESGVLETASVYQYANQRGTDTGSFSEQRTTASIGVRFLVPSGNATNETSQFYTYLYNLGNSAKYSFNTYHSYGIAGSGASIMAFGGGVLPQTSTVNGLRFNAIKSGTIKLYGVKQIWVT